MDCTLCGNSGVEIDIYNDQKRCVCLGNRPRAYQPTAIEISAGCAATLQLLTAYRDRLWCVSVVGDIENITHAIGDSAEDVRAAYRERYRGDWMIAVWPAVATVDGKRCAWCARHGRYSH